VSFAWRPKAVAVLLLLVGGCGAPRVEAPPQGSGTRGASRPVADVAPPDPVEARGEGAGEVLGMAAEYGPVEQVLLGWSDDAWLYLPTYLGLIHGLAAHAPVLLVVDGFEQQFMVAHELARHGVQLGAVEFAHAPLDSMWMRDYGPLVVRLRDGTRRIVDAPYGRVHDDAVPRMMATKLGWEHAALPIELDGGHLQIDGEGRCIVSEDVPYLNVERGQTEEQTLEALREHLGCRQVTLVPPLLLEETGHVDVFLYVTGPGRVLLGRYRPIDDGENHRRLETTARLLRQAGFEVDRIPMPSNARRTVFRSYTNALATNQAVFVPTYRRDRRFERAALNGFRRSFPGRAVIAVPADDVIELGGAIHCLAMTLMAP
jgi:agmatine deiminase